MAAKIKIDSENALVKYFKNVKTENFVLTEFYNHIQKCISHKEGVYCSSFEYIYENHTSEIYVNLEDFCIDTDSKLLFYDQEDGEILLKHKDFYIFLNIDLHKIKFYYLLTNENAKKLINVLVAGFKKFLIPKKPSLPKGNIYMLGIRGKGMKAALSFLPTKIAQPKLKIENNYNDDFAGVNATILERLNTQNDKGIVVLHGKPGTGKTNYLKYLCHNVPKKKLLYVPSELVYQIVEPSFMNLLKKHKNSILIIEDGDNVVRKRQEVTTQVASTILNITDGFMNDVLKMQIVVTFNIDKSEIDPAFLREGRLIAEYYFEELAFEKADALSQKLGFEPIGKPEILAKIYNQDKARHISKPKQGKIGFQK